MKKALAMILSVFMVFSVFCNAAWANADNTVFADTVTAEAGERITVPVKIKNNSGFMGFTVIFDYDTEVFTPISVSKGAMLSGMLNDSIETSADNSFKVVFTGTENITEDGVLFNVTFDVSDKASGEKHNIGLSYSSSDTFAEGWDAVELNCKDIEAIVTVNGTTLPTTTTITQAPSTEPFETEQTTENTEPSTGPAEEPVEQGKPLSVRMKEWVNGLTKPFNVILGIFVLPLAFIISIFE